MSSDRSPLHRRLARASRGGRWPALVVGAAIVLAACGGGNGGEPSDGTDASSGDGTSSDVTVPAGDTDEAPPAAGAAEILDALLASGEQLGAEIDAAAVSGRPIVAWFWAPWCTICRAEAPEVAEVAAAHADEVVLLGIPGRGAIDEMQGFIDDTGTGGITHVADLDGTVWSEFGVFGQPAFAFVSADGDVSVFVGSLGEDALTEQIAQLVEA